MPRSLTAMCVRDNRSDDSDDPLFARLGTLAVDRFEKDRACFCCFRCRLVRKNPCHPHRHGELSFTGRQRAAFQRCIMDTSAIPLHISLFGCRPFKQQHW